MTMPLAEIFRPTKLSDVVGQEHITGEGRLFDRILKTGILQSMIFFGPAGVGKTTCANIISSGLNAPIYKFNATYNKTEEIKDVIKKYSASSLITAKPIIYVDEIQNFNKKQQQIFLEFVEKGTVSLIGATAENPGHYIYPALISRCIIVEFYKVTAGKIIKNLQNCVDKLNASSNKNIALTDEALSMIADYADMDVRKSVNLLEIIINLYSDENSKFVIDKTLLKNLGISRRFAYDMKGDEYYDLLSAFQKSIRGSDENAALFYLARAIKAGDIKPVCRRLLVIASEDIGLAYPQAAAIVKSCVDSALALGLPEARLPLAEAVLLLATAPKSNSVITAIDAALSSIEQKGAGDVPIHLKDAHYAMAEKLGRGTDYKYPHDFKNSYVKQQYLPDNHKDDVYYKGGNNKYESLIKAYWSGIKK